MVTGRILVESRAPSPGTSGPRMKRPLANAILLMALTAVALAQTHTTVRHYKERIDDTPPRNRAGRRCHPEKRFHRRGNAAEKGYR